MEIIDIKPSDSKLWEQVWMLYNESFPEYERRRISSHERACDDAAFNTKIAVENGNLLALLFYWKYDGQIYVEHLAVNPKMRGNNIGSRIISDFLKNNPDHKIILEIDPPVDDLSRRRQGFYERLGFVVNDYDYTHPSYRKNGHGHKLVVLSYPEPLSDEQFEFFKTYMADKILQYID